MVAGDGAKKHGSIYPDQEPDAQPKPPHLTPPHPIDVYIVPPSLPHCSQLGQVAYLI